MYRTVGKCLLQILRIFEIKVYNFDDSKKMLIFIWKSFDFIIIVSIFVFVAVVAYFVHVYQYIWYTFNFSTDLWKCMCKPKKNFALVLQSFRITDADECQSPVNYQTYAQHNTFAGLQTKH